MSDSEPEVEAASTVAAVAPSTDPFVDGDWICAEPECKNVNFARRTACNRCNAERVLSAADKKKFGIEIGKAAADKSRGLFSAEDWQCSKCANVNWARRNTCNMCNAPKFIDVEERTGYGGGYNDRGVVEYKEHREASDDEYDEFGRRKKKREGKVASSASDEARRKPIESVKEPAKLSEKLVSVQKSKVSDDEEDDDEEDDDDADLSKYDLWGDDDDDDETEAGEKFVPKDSPAKPPKAPQMPGSSSSSGSSSPSSSRTLGQYKRSDSHSRSPRSNHKSSRSDRRRSRSTSRSRDASRTKSVSSRTSHSRRSRSRSSSKSRPNNGQSKQLSRSDYRSRSRSPIQNNSKSKYGERLRR